MADDNVHFNTKHGQARRGKKTPEYATWVRIKTRCSNPKLHNFRYYGGKGIKVCDRWINGEDGKSGFECFLEDMGPRPSKDHTIDRKDSNKDYEPDNCKWATHKEQQNNTSYNVPITYKGETHNLGEWATILGLKYTTLHRRLTALGWTIEEAFTSPIVHTE